MNEDAIIKGNVTIEVNGTFTLPSDVAIKGDGDDQTGDALTIKAEHALIQGNVGGAGLTALSVEAADITVDPGPNDQTEIAVTDSITLVAEADTIVRLGGDPPDAVITLTSALLEAGSITISASSQERGLLFGYVKDATATITITSSATIDGGPPLPNLEEIISPSLGSIGSGIVSFSDGTARVKVLEGSQIVSST